MRPRIGIASYWTQARWTYWDMPATVLPQGYVEGVRLAGGLPLVLPPTPEGAEDPGAVLDAVDGLVLPGGPDLGVDLYGDPPPHEETGAKQARRDAFESALCREALRRALPVLGICRGMQLLNVVRGGTLEQHLADVVDLEPHRPRPGAFGSHDVSIASGSVLAGLLDGRVEVRSAHHQGVARIGSGLVASARAQDGTVEALEDPALPFCLGVLWHPEEQVQGAGAPLFAGLVEAARAYRMHGEGALR